MRRLLLASALVATMQIFSAVAQTPPMVPSLCPVGASSSIIPVSPMLPTCVASAGPPPPTCSNSLDLSKACNSANLDLL